MICSINIYICLSSVANIFDWNACPSASGIDLDAAALFLVTSKYFINYISYSFFFFDESDSFGYFLINCVFLYVQILTNVQRMIVLCFWIKILIIT